MYTRGGLIIIKNIQRVDLYYKDILAVSIYPKKDGWYLEHHQEDPMVNPLYLGGLSDTYKVEQYFSIRRVEINRGRKYRGFKHIVRNKKVELYETRGMNSDDDWWLKFLPMDDGLTYKELKRRRGLL